jgi:acetylornithine aminotransferase/acetylornithine/N-succinyldiaminopimelate aminotransferase
MKTKELIGSEKKYLMQTYGRPGMVLDKGEGMKVWDLEGKQYYDFIGGIAVNALGYSHPKLVQAIKNQAEKLIHCSNLYYSEPQIILAQMLVELSCGDKVFFANSGAEVNEGAIKLAVKYFKEQNKDKHKIIYMKNSFHGRTIGTLAATGKYKYQKDYLPLLPKFKQEGLRELCNKKDMLLIFDEIQCGLGRTGKVFAYQYYNVEPDILTLAKSLGGGLPIGALIAKEKVASSFKPGDHGTTFGGNPLVCAAAIANLKVLQEENLITKCKKKGKYFKKKLEGLKEKYPEYIKEIRVLGLMVGLEIKKDGPEVVKKCLEERVLINCTAENVLRFLPSLIVKEEEIDYLIGVLDKIFKKM